MPRRRNAYPQHRDAILKNLREKNARWMVRFLRRCDWPLRQHAFGTLRRINPVTAIDVELLMGPDEIRDMENVFAKPFLASLDGHRDGVSR